VSVSRLSPPSCPPHVTTVVGSNGIDPTANPLMLRFQITVRNSSQLASMMSARRVVGGATSGATSV
jgi:hypothetical protein